MSNIQAIAKGLLKSTEKGGTYIRRGRGVLELEKITHKNGHKGESYIFDLKVISSEPLQGPGETPNPSGSKCAYVQNTGNEYAWQNLVAVVLGFTGTEFKDFEEAAKDSRFKKALVDKGVLGPAAEWTAAHEFEAFLNEAAETGSLQGSRCMYQTNNPVEGKAKNMNIYPNFSPIPEA
jgi:hypothetical protein